MMGDPSPRPYCVSVCGAETHAHGSKSSRADEMHPKVNGRGLWLTTRPKSVEVGTGLPSSRTPDEVIGKNI